MNIWGNQKLPEGYSLKLELRTVKLFTCGSSGQSVRENVEVQGAKTYAVRFQHPTLSGMRKLILPLHSLISSISSPIHLNQEDKNGNGVLTRARIFTA